MRSVLYGAACSLDGYIAGPNEEVDWLHWSDDVAQISNAVFSRIDTILLGRKTYDVAVRMGVRSYPGGVNYVFSSTLQPADAPEVTVVRDDAVEFVRALKQAPGKDICVIGGGELARSLINAGLIDEIGVNIQPVVLGSGIPLLPPGGARVNLTLTESRVLSGGCVYALYRVTHAGGEPT
jgi:dihydrofolate reductase